MPALTKLTTALVALSKKPRPSVYDLLALLGGSLRCDIPLARIRYYRRSVIGTHTESLVSNEVWGCQEPDRKLFKDGLAVRFWDTASPKPSTPDTAEKESFFCLFKKRPIAFIVGISSELPLRATIGRDKVIIPIPIRDHCPILKKPIGTVWIDIPLIFQNKLLGKLSCELESPRKKVLTSEHLQLLSDCAYLITPYLESIHNDRFESLKRTPELEEVRSHINRAASIKMLLECLVSDLPKAFRCRHASIFLMSIDDLKWQRLILRHTTYPTLRKQIDLAAYDLGKDFTGDDCRESLTGWVATNKTTLRLHNFPSKREVQQFRTNKSVSKQCRHFFEELGKYSPPVMWGDKFTDSDQHTSFLAVPIISSHDDRLLGVLRFTEKLGPDARFSDVDQMLLEWFVSDVLSRRLEDLPAVQIAKELLPEIERIFDPKAFGATVSDFAPVVCDNLRQSFEQKGHRKVVLLNALTQDGRAFRHRAVSFTRGWNPNMAYDKYWPLQDNMTASIISIDEPVFFNNLQHAKDEKAYVSETVPRAVCALGYHVKLDERVFGALLVLSDRFDLDKQTDGKMIELASKQLSQIMGRLRLRTFSFALSGLRHDCLNMLQLSTERIAKAQSMATCVHDLVNTYTQSYPLEKDALFDSIEASDIRALITKLIECVQAATGITRHRITPKCSALNGELPHIETTLTSAVIYNVLKNAVTTCVNKGTVKVRVYLERSDMGSYLIVRIKDSGPGIPPEKEAEIRKYMEADPLCDLVAMLNPSGSATDTASAKKGIGLPMIAKLMEQYVLPDGRSGQIEFDANPGKGACFRIRIPINDAK